MHHSSFGVSSSLRVFPGQPVASCLSPSVVFLLPLRLALTPQIVRGADRAIKKTSTAEGVIVIRLYPAAAYSPRSFSSLCTPSVCFHLFSSPALTLFRFAFFSCSSGCVLRGLRWPQWRRGCEFRTGKPSSEYFSF